MTEELFSGYEIDSEEEGHKESSSIDITSIEDQPGNSVPYQTYSFWEEASEVKFGESGISNKGRAIGTLSNLLDRYDVEDVEEMVKVIIFDWKACQDKFDYHGRKCPVPIDLMKLHEDISQRIGRGVVTSVNRMSDYRKKFVEEGND